MPAVPDLHILLCERCGYPIGPLGPDALCPECGTPTLASLPDARPGSPWQQRPSLGALALTTWQALRSPGRLFRSIKPVRAGPTRLLLVIRLAIASGLIVLMWAVFNLWSRTHGLWYVRTTPAPTGGTGGGFFGTGVTSDALLVPRLDPLACLGAFPAVMAMLLLLTWIEVWGVQFFGRRRGWRVTPAIAWAVCAHAAVGWTLAGFLYALSPAVLRACDPILDMLPPTQAVLTCEALATAIPALAFFAGMLVFETLVYVGIRACRFANAPVPEVAPRPATAA